MDSKARRERDRRRLPERSPWARWTRRIVGVLATAAFVGVAFAIFDMVRPDGGAAVTASEATATATPKAEKSKKSSKKKASKPKPLTAKEKRARADAVAQLRAQGDTT